MIYANTLKQHWLHLSLIASGVRETKEKSAASELKLEHELNIAKGELKATKDELERT